MEPMKTSEIAQQVTNIQGEMAYFHDLLNQLEDKLDIVTQPSLPTTGGQNPGVPSSVPMQSPMGNILKDAAQNLSSSNARLLDIINRVQL